MKNFEKIKEIYELFKFDDVRCYVELERLKNNFEINDDDLIFEIKAESSQPMKEIAEKLIADGKKELVGDEIFMLNNEYLKEDIKTNIYIKNRFGKKTLFRICIRLDEDGEIAAITAPSKYSEERKYSKKVVEKWLKKEFGKVY
jgi:rRNA maturation protein Nop10